MPRRLARLFFRMAGWLLTPLVLLSAAGIGATIGLVIAPTLSPNAGLGLTASLSLAAAIAGLLLWVRLLREHPSLRHTLEMTTQGAPESPLVERLIHPDATEAGDPP
jgi:hypothetical protein